MPKYRWIIDIDYYDGTSKGVEGPRNLDESIPFEEKFKMYDDDGNLIYTGRIGGDYSGFEPIDDYGMPNFGCTEIHYKNKKTGEWRVL